MHKGCNTQQKATTSQREILLLWPEVLSLIHPRMVKKVTPWSISLTKKYNAPAAVLIHTSTQKHYTAQSAKKAEIRLSSTTGQ